MPVLNIKGICVDFPFEPYDVQQDYMTSVVDCLTKATNGILESPTGTGKTLCLLCASLAWQITRKAQLQAMSLTMDDGNVTSGLQAQLGAAGGWTARFMPPKIIYASRTHSQLAQVIGELKRTAYKHVKTAILGSRDQLCIHPQVSKEKSSSAKILLCHSKVTSRTCFFHSNLEKKKEERMLTETSVVDIEDMVKAGKKISCCPYYMSRELKQNADIVFMPYNYLIDPLARRSQGIELQGNVVIFDEAHNIEKSCEESASFQLSSSDVALCINEVTDIMRVMVEQAEGGEANWAADSQVGAMDFTAEELAVLKTMFLELEKSIDAIELKAVGSELSLTKPGDYFLELLSQAHITPERIVVTVELLDKIVQYLSGSTSGVTRKGASLQRFSDMLRVVYSREGFSVKHLERIKQCYRIYIRDEEQRNKRQNDGWSGGAAAPQGKKGKVLSYWCFSPSVGMQELMEQGVHSLILTSGTLSPLNAFASEMQVPFPVQLSNPHVVGEHQIWAGIITHGPDGTLLSSAFSNRQNTSYINSLGQTLFNLSRVVPNGLLVFFPSYPSLRYCQEAWQKSGIWQKVEQFKTIHVEPQTKDGFQTVMDLFYCGAAQEKGACFMAVCRGKVSEGLDFADMNGRAVLVTGIPYPPFKDPRIVLKQSYLDEKKNSVSGRDWYRLEAVRAVNQAIGRVIRHRFDYGAIILCDQRFAQPAFKAELSGWIQSRLQIYNTFGKALGELTPFYRTAAKLLPKPTAEIREATEIARSQVTEAIPRKLVGGNFQQAPSRFCEKNTIVECQSEDSPDTAFSAYGGEMVSGATPSMGTGMDLLSRLDNIQQPAVIDFSELMPSTSQSRPASMVSSASKKRKIQIVSSKNKEVSPAFLSPLDPKTGSRQYLAQVKTILPEDMYKNFSKAIAIYFKSHNFDLLIGELERVFIKETKHPNLFVGFRQFVLPDHVREFEEKRRSLGLY